MALSPQTTKMVSNHENRKGYSIYKPSFFPFQLPRHIDAPRLGSRGARLLRQLPEIELARQRQTGDIDRGSNSTVGNRWRCH